MPSERPSEKREVARRSVRTVDANRWALGQLKAQKEQVLLVSAAESPELAALDACVTIRNFTTPF